MTYIFRNTSPSILLNFREEVLRDVGKGHVKFGYGELGISYKKAGNSIWCKGVSYENGHFNFIMHMAW